MIYKIKQFEDKLIDKAYNKAMRDLNKFYELNWEYNKPRIIIIDDRKTIDLWREEKTEDWVKAWTWCKTIIFMLNRKNLEKESSHKYNKEIYIATVNHELSHLFFSIVSKNGYCPAWLKEGLSIYTSEQNKWKIKPDKFSTFLSFDKKGGSSVYRESGFVVDTLIKKFGKKKLLNLIKQSKDSKNSTDFKKLFSKIYKFDLNYKNLNKIHKEKRLPA